MPKYTDKVVIVTGASSGIGAATALAFAERGAKLTITGQNQERLEKIAQECVKNEGCEVLQIISDLTIFDNLKPVIDKTVGRFGGIDILVNNAGKTNMKSVADLTGEEYQQVMDLNLRAPVFLSKLALPYLQKSKGCVVNVSSCISSKAIPNGAAYGMTKIALDHFTRGFAAECAGFGVRVNAVNPGAVRTNIWAGHRFSIDDFLPIQPFGAVEAKEIAETILFIASSDHMTGSCVLHDGGILLSLGTK